MDGTDNIKMGLKEILKPATSGTKTLHVLPGCLIFHDIKIRLRERGRSSVQHAFKFFFIVIPCNRSRYVSY